MRNNLFLAVLFVLLLPFVASSQPLVKPAMPVKVDLTLPENKVIDPIAILWPFPWLRVTGTIGFNSNAWGSGARMAQYMGYDFRVKMYLEDKTWSILLRSQTMYVDTDASLLLGGTYRIPNHLPRKKHYKL